LEDSRLCEHLYLNQILRQTVRVMFV